MKILWIFLLICSCSKIKNKMQQTNIIGNQSDQLSANYDKGLDVILVKTDVYNWYKDLINYKLDRSSYENHADEDLYWTFYGSLEQQMIDYSSGIYWNSNDHTYYYAKISITNGIKYTLDTNLQYELRYNAGIQDKNSYALYKNLKLIKELFYSEQTNLYFPTYQDFLYSGSLSPLERIYYNPSRNTQYIKELRRIDDSIYHLIVSNETTQKYIDKNNSITNFFDPKRSATNYVFSRNTDPLYPYFDKQINIYSDIEPYRVVLSNNKGDRFEITDREYYLILEE